MPAGTAERKHPLHAMTTYALHDRRRELEHATKGITSDALIQAMLRTELDAHTMSPMKG